MNFDFSSPDDHQAFLQACGLIKNGGFFKSAKQAQFLNRNAKFATQDGELYGIPIKVGQRTITADARIRWTDYGSRSVIPVMFVFVYDEYGVVARFKVPFKGNLRDGAYPDDSRTMCQWTRPVDAVVPEYLNVYLEKQDEQPVGPVSEYILHGMAGARITLKGVIKSIRTFQGNAMHYYDNGMRTVTTINCNGNIVTYFNALSDADVGDEVEFTATIKNWSEYNGVKQTTVSRALKIKVSKREETCHM